MLSDTEVYVLRDKFQCISLTARAMNGNCHQGEVAIKTINQYEN